MPTKPTTKRRRKADPADTIRQAVEAERRRQDHTHEALAKGAKVDRAAITRWLGGTRDMRVSQLARIMAYLGLAIAIDAEKIP